MGYETGENQDDFDPLPPSNGKPARDLLVILTLALIGIMLGALLGLGAGCAAANEVRDRAEDAADVVKNAGKAAEPLGTVYRFESPSGQHICSAVAVSHIDFLIAAHCVIANQSPADPFRVRHLVGEPMPVFVTEVFPGRDLAQVRLVDHRVSLYAQVATQPPGFGDPVVSIGWGCLKGEAPMITPGLVMNLDPDGLIDVGVKVCLGDSGGGLFNAKGELVGVTSMRGTYGESIPAGFFVQVAGGV